MVKELKIEEPVKEMLSEYSTEELLDMLQTLGDSYLECCESKPDMTIIHQQRVLEKFLKRIDGPK